MKTNRLLTASLAALLLSGALASCGDDEDNGLDAKTVMKAADHHDLNITTQYVRKHADKDLVKKLNEHAVEF